MSLTDERITELTKQWAEEWMKIWEEASPAAVERNHALFAHDSVYHATTFSEAVGIDRIIIIQSMPLVQQNGKGSTKFLGVTGGLGIFTWEIKYEVKPQREWSSPQKIMNSPEWESFRAIPFADDKPNPIEQAGIATLEFNDDELVTHFREYWFTKMLDR